MIKEAFYIAAVIAGIMGNSIYAMEEADAHGMNLRCPSIAEVQNAMNSNQDTIDVDGIHLHITKNKEPGANITFKHADLGTGSDVLTCRYNFGTISSAKMKHFDYMGGARVEAPGRRFNNMVTFYFAQNNDPENIHFTFIAEDNV